MSLYNCLYEDYGAFVMVAGLPLQLGFLELGARPVAGELAGKS